MQENTEDTTIQIDDLAQQISNDLSEEYDGIRSGGDGPNKNGEIMLWITACDQETDWEEVVSARTELTRRLEYLGLSWKENPEMEQRAWEMDSVGGGSGPYLEIKTSRVSSDHVQRYKQAPFSSDELVSEGVT